MKRIASFTVSGASQRGFLLITAVALIVIAALILTTMVYLSATSNNSGAGNLQSGQALFIAETGLENQQRQLAQNLNWYRSFTSPIVTGPVTFAQGTYMVNTYLPATLLRNQIPDGTSTNPIIVNTTANFPTPTSTPIACNPCYLQVDDDITISGTEFVQYTGISGNSFTGITRGKTIGGVASPLPLTGHDHGSTVYPVTTLITNLPSNCNSLAIQIVAHPKFLSAGTVDIQGEEIGYASSSISGAVMTLNGVTRCLDDVTGPPGNTPAAHVPGAPVTPVLVGDYSADYQVEMISTGTVGNATRSTRKTIQR